VSFTIAQGETLGLVGESGSGKSTTGRLLLRLIEPTAGRVLYGEHDVFKLPKNDMRALRREMQIVFQDPYGAFNPRMNVGQIIGEALELRGMKSRSDRDREVERFLELVQMPTNIGTRYPHEFSGGQRQRIGIARALAVEPKFVVADEPVSALDVSTQAEIVNLLLDLQQSLNLTMLFISHDLSVVRVLCDRVAVMFAGRILELADASALFKNPLQPYTQELLAAIPIPDPTRAKRRGAVVSNGEVSTETANGATASTPADVKTATTATQQAQGCPYAGRCPQNNGYLLAGNASLYRLRAAPGRRETALCSMPLGRTERRQMNHKGYGEHRGVSTWRLRLNGMMTTSEDTIKFSPLQWACALYAVCG
jgi:ABC-type oligopeptide transport system ATPase subunit